MRAVLCRALGDPTKPRSEGGALAVEDVPSPRCPADGVKVRVDAASLNFADVLLVQGSYQEKPRMPFIPGGECAGVVTESGANVRGLKVATASRGDDGRGRDGGGVRHPERMCFPVPAGVSLAQAAAFPVAFGTAHLALTRYAGHAGPDGARPGRRGRRRSRGGAGGEGLSRHSLPPPTAHEDGALEDAGADHRIDASTLHSKGGARKDDYAGLKAAVGKISPGG